MTNPETPLKLPAPPGGHRWRIKRCAKIRYRVILNDGVLTRGSRDFLGNPDDELAFRHAARTAALIVLRDMDRTPLPRRMEEETL